MKRGAWGLLIVLAAWAASGVYFVQPDEVVLVRRCGRLLPMLHEPGAHFGLPWGIDERERVKPREVKRVSVGPVSLASETSGSASTQFLTADRNLVQVRATVQYTLADPAQYVRQLHVAERLVAIAGEAVLARGLAALPVDLVLTQGKNDLAVRAREELQATLDRCALGVAVRSVDLGGLEPPPEVAAAFADVVAAQREREQATNQAHSAASQTLAEARAEAQRRVDQARGDSERRVRAAGGEAERFERLLAEYRQSPELTAHRLYWEALAEILPRLRAKLLIDDGQPLDLSVFGPVRERNPSAPVEDGKP